VTRAVPLEHMAQRLRLANAGEGVSQRVLDEPVDPLHHLHVGFESGCPDLNRGPLRPEQSLGEFLPSLSVEGYRRMSR
jgi:hypothetical protein